MDVVFIILPFKDQQEHTSLPPRHLFPTRTIKPEGDVNFPYFPMTED